MTKHLLRVVIDSNVLISALAFGGKPRAVVTSGFTGKFRPITSHFISEELKRGLIKLGHTITEAEILVASYESVAELVYLEEVIALSRDPKDDPIIATAIMGYADYIVTGDNDLLELIKYKNMRFIAPADSLHKVL